MLQNKFILTFDVGIKNLAYCIVDEKMTDLESKNPQLKELGDFIYERAPDSSPRSRRPASSEPTPKRSRT
jgi:hypothetical protein